MGPQQRRANTRTALLGVVGIAVMVLVVYVAITADSGLPFRKTTTVKAAFHDIGSIHTNSQVRQNSLRVGRVAKVEYVDGQAVATLELDGERKVYANARASVQDFSALAQKFIELEPGSPQAGPLGARVIAADKNADSADIYQLLDVFDPKTLSAATSATRELGGGAAGHGADLHDFLHASPRLLPQLGTVSAALASDDADVPSLLRGADQLATRLVDHRQQLSRAIGQTGDTLGAVSTDDGKPLGETLRRLPGTLDHAKLAFDHLDNALDDTAAFFRDFRGGADALGRSEGDLRAALREIPQPLRKVPSFSEDASPAIGDLADTVQDARPLAPRVAQAFDHLASPVAVLAPYALDIESLWARLRNMTSETTGGEHYGRTTFNVNGRMAGVLSPSAVGNDPYPAPGEASRDRQGSLIYGGSR
jgi:phospholipid/cholesterol/gamma-HCH transport system substrate-binding protein